MAFVGVAPLLVALLALPAADAGALRHRLREEALPQALLAQPAAASPAAASPAAAVLPHNMPHDEEHSGSPGNGGRPMVPRSHMPVGNASPSHEYWTYEAPQNWAAGYGECAGDGQSPVNIDWEKAVTSPDRQDVAYLAQHAKYHPLADREIGNNGHNLQVNGKFGSLALPDGEYDVAQFHFHFPSEHEVNGKLAAGEIHIVHQKRGSQGTDDLAVVAVLLESTEHGAEELAFLTNLGFGGPHDHTHLPKQHEEFHVDAPVDLNVFETSLKLGFWHYKGSLTTPPCSQTVHWYVAQHPASVTPEMVNSFKALFPAPSNNRPVQPLNERKVLFSEVGVPGEFAAAAPAPELTTHDHHPTKSAALRAGALASLGLWALLL